MVGEKKVTLLMKYPVLEKFMVSALSMLGFYVKTHEVFLVFLDTKGLNLSYQSILCILSEFSDLGGKKQGSKVKDSDFKF